MRQSFNISIAYFEALWRAFFTLLVHYKMSRLLIFVFLTIILFSCKPDNIAEVLKTSKKPEIDMVFHSIIIEEKVNGSATLVLDKATDEGITGITEFDTIKSKQNGVIYWNKHIFPRINYLSQKTYDSIQKNQDLFWEFAKKNNQGWIKISQPIFTNDKKRAIVFVEYSNPDNYFGATTRYILEKINGDYQIVERKLVLIS